MENPETPEDGTAEEQSPEKDTPTALAPRDPAAPTPTQRSILARLGLGEEPSRAAKYLRAILAGLQEASSEQIKQIPVVGPIVSGTVAALLELSGEEDGEAFEVKLTQLLTVGEQSREDLESLAGLSAAIYLRQDELLARLESLGLPAAPAQLNELALSAALTAWRGRVARDYQYADYRGIEGGTRAEHAAALPMDDVYVVPRLVPERERADLRDRERFLLKELLDNQDLPTAERVRLEEEFAVLTGERWKAGEKEGGGLPLGEALTKARHAVILGGPGTGKSALTRHLARTCALGQETGRERLGWEEDLTPVVLPLAGYTDARQTRKSLTVREYLDERLQEHGGEALQVAMAAELEAGRVLVLLDGVDEIPNSRDRVLIVRAVESFLADHAANRIVITSRPYGYVRLTGEIPHFQLPNFSPDQVTEFLTRWQRAFEGWRHPEAPDLARAECEAKEMLTEIGRNPKVSELASNPLMLVILALIRHERTRLPQERVQLYNRAVSTLVDTWNRGRSLAGIDVGGVHLPLERMVRVWGAVAEWTRRARPAGVVHRAELKRKLVEILREREYDEDDPEATAESYLNAAADRAGLLEERGRDIFAFWHPTFEEFLAAVELTTPTARAIERLLPLRDDPRWREVILLAVGYVGIVQKDGDTATEIVEAIWQRDPGPLEPLLHSHLRLAAACVADDVGVKRSLTERIILRLGEIVWELPYKPLTEALRHTLIKLKYLRPSTNMVKGLEPLTRHQDELIRAWTTYLISNVTAENSNARCLCEVLLDDNYPLVFEFAALGMARSGDFRLEVWEGLYSASYMKEVREIVASAPEEAWDVLLRMLKDKDPHDCVKAAEILTEMGSERSEPVCLTLEGLLLNSDDVEVKLRANKVLNALEGNSSGIKEDKSLYELLDELLDIEIPQIQLRLIPELWAQGWESERLRSALEPLLETEDLRLRLRAALMAQEIESSSRSTSDISGIFERGTPVERLWAARVLVRLEEAEMGVLEELAKSLQPYPWAYLNACQKVRSGLPLGATDIKELKGLFLVHPEDTPEKAETRRILFDWLCSKLESVNAAL